MARMLELSDRDFFFKSMINMPRDLMDKVNNIQEWVDYVKREFESLRKN